MNIHKENLSNIFCKNKTGINGKKYLKLRAKLRTAEDNFCGFYQSNMRRRSLSLSQNKRRIVSHQVSDAHLPVDVIRLWGPIIIKIRPRIALKVKTLEDRRPWGR